MQLALDRGADVNEANDAGQTALHVAAAQRGEEFIRFLVARGARLDAKDKQGRTPLDVALGLGGRGRGRSPGARAAVAAVLRELSKLVVSAFRRTGRTVCEEHSCPVWS